MRMILATCLTVGLVLSALPLAAQEDMSATAAPNVNAIRADSGLPKLAVSAQLTRAAMAHASDMAANGFFGHTGSDGSGIGDRARAAGYGYCFISENIAKGQGSLAAVMNDWMNSSGHRRNVLSDGAREFALVRDRGNIWVMVLGRPGC